MAQVTATRSWKGKLWFGLQRAVFLGLPLLVLLVAVGGFIAMGALSPQPEERENVIEAQPVLTAPATTGSARLTVEAQGEVTPRASVTLASEVAGRIAWVHDDFIAGGRFDKGELLVRLDPREFDLRVVQAQASVAEARTALLTETSQAETAALEARDLGLENVSDLALRRPQVAEAEARLASAQAALAEARLLRSRAEIRAPFSGRVRSKAVDIGTYVSPGTQLGEVYSSDVMEVPLALTDTDLARLDLGVGFQATPDAPGPDVRLSAIIAGQRHHWQGRIVRTDSGFDTDTRVLFAFAQVDDPYGKGAHEGAPLAAGLFVTAEIEGREIESAVFIPRTGLRGTDEVYVASADGTMEIRSVSVAYSDRDHAVLTAGLQPGEQVIVSPVRGAADGMTIKPVESRALSETETAAKDE